MRFYTQATVFALILAGSPAAGQQSDADAYTRYELLAPGTHKFRVIFEITATRAGATRYYNPIRAGSVASDERVTDRSTGRPLPFREVEGSVAKAGGVGSATPESRYIEVTLPNPVAADGGEARLLIDKTYEDAKSYFSDGDQIVFDRSLGNKRNAVVLPRGYEVISVNVPAQVLEEADGRIKIAFWNDGAAAAPLVVRASPVSIAAPPATNPELSERAHQDREIVYWLQDPATHSFALAHDYTESRVDVGTYVNVVRAGSTVSAPSARNLDTGEAIPFELVKGRAAVLAAAPEMRDVPADASAVVFRFDPVKAGQSMRLRIAETYTDAERYRLEGSELIWRRSLGRPANAVVLPEGWVLTNSSVPATVRMDNGRVRLDFINPRTDEIDTVITARRRRS